MEENCDPLARRVPSFAQGKRILLVDRDASSLKNIASVLESHSYKVTTAELESIAMSIFSEHKDEFDAVMVDMNMKDMTSLEFVKGILLTKSYAPIILMSSMGDEAIINQALIEGACHFLEKPIPNDQLQQIWQHVHRMRKLSEEDSGSGSKTNIAEGGATIKQKVIEPKKSAGIHIKELENDCRPATGVDFQEIDPKGKNKQVKAKVVSKILNSKLPIGLTMDGIDELRMEANERGGCSSRKRTIHVDDVNGEERKLRQRSECSELPGKNPSGETGSPSERNLKGFTSVAKQSNIQFTAGANPKAVQDMGIGNFTQRHNPSLLQSILNNGENAGTIVGVGSGMRAPQCISQEQEQQGSAGLILGDGWSSGPSQNFSTQYGWPDPSPFTSLSHGRDLVPETNPFAYAANTNFPAEAGGSANPDPSIGRVDLDEEELAYLTELLRNPLYQDNPHIQPFDDASQL